MRTIVLMCLLVCACNPKGTCEDYNHTECEEITKSDCKERKDRDFISNAHCSTLGYTCRDNDGRWTKTCR